MDIENRYIIEFIKIGETVKVTAVDPNSGVEASIIAPAHGYTKQYLQGMAVKKLNYVLKKKSESV